MLKTNLLLLSAFLAIHVGAHAEYVHSETISRADIPHLAATAVPATADLVLVDPRGCLWKVRIDDRGILTLAALVIDQGTLVCGAKADGMDPQALESIRKQLEAATRN